MIEIWLVSICFVFVCGVACGVWMISLNHQTGVFSRDINNILADEKKRWEQERKKNRELKK